MLILWLFFFRLTYNTSDTWLKHYRLIVSRRLDGWFKMISSDVLNFLFLFLHYLFSGFEFLPLVSELPFDLEQVG